MKIQKTYKALFLCTGNSARSILAEVILNHLGRGHFQAYSAGSKPTGKVHPASLRLLQRMGLPSAELRSKNWDEFAASAAPKMDFIFTVCDKAVGEECPLWPGSPVTAHWGMEDPAACTGSEAEQDKAFEQVYQRLTRRIQLFISLPFTKLDALSLLQRLQEIGRS